jgi:hypothetical protein
VDAAIQWLLEGDPAIRWQALRDLVGAPERTVARERRRVATKGWGARLLARQDASGRWAAGSSPDTGLYSPKWTSTTYTMLLLRDFGLPSKDRRARKACGPLLDRGLQPDGGVSYGTWAQWTHRGETCITDDRLDTIAQHLLEQQMPDGGWNYRRSSGATHSSVNTTISVLEGLRLYEVFRRRRVVTMRRAQQRGREFLLAHRLFRSHRTGRVIKPIFTRFAFPPRWHYDILRALDHFRSVDAPRDERLADAIDVVRRTERADGRWVLDHAYPGKTYFQLERVGAPSRWNTLRALRVLGWWDRERE